MKNLFTKLSLALLVATPAVFGDPTEDKENNSNPEDQELANTIATQLREESDKTNQNTSQKQNGGKDTQKEQDEQENEQTPSRLRRAFLNKYAYGVYSILGAAATGYVADRYFNDGKAFDFLGRHTKSVCDKTYLSAGANKVKGGTKWVCNKIGLSWFGGKVSSFAGAIKDTATTFLAYLQLLNAGKQAVDNFSNNKKPVESEKIPQQGDSADTHQQGDSSKTKNPEQPNSGASQG